MIDTHQSYVINFFIDLYSIDVVVLQCIYILLKDSYEDHQIVIALDFIMESNTLGKRLQQAEKCTGVH